MSSRTPRLIPAGPAGGGASPPNYPARLKFLYDTLWLEADTGRTSRTYRIMQVDNQTKAVTLDARPTCAGDRSKWRLNRRPILVAIDPLGPRVRDGTTLAGNAATVARQDPADASRTILRLDGAMSLARINKAFDTIYLATDTTRTPSRPGPVYRIVNVDEAAREVTVVGAPTLDGGASPWHIPAGVGGTPPATQYDLGPHQAAAPVHPDRQRRGYDHYDGALFIVRRGRVEGHHIYRWSTYTSRDYGTPWTAIETGLNWQESLSSLRGNARYYYSSYRSDSTFKNFTFTVVDATAGRNGLQPVATDSVAQARFYFGTPSPPAAAVPGNANALDPRVMADPNGKRLIRLHRGSRNQAGTGSAGCVVSPDYLDMRTELLRLFEDDYKEYYGPKTFDAEVRKLTNASSPQASTNLWTLGDQTPDLTEANWLNKVVGTIWVIRPDERPISP